MLSDPRVAGRGLPCSRMPPAPPPPSFADGHFVKRLFMVLGVVMAVGLAVSIFQAVTQIHEATLAFVPKLVAAVLVSTNSKPTSRRLSAVRSVSTSKK